MSYPAPKPIWPSAQRPMINNGSPPTSQHVDNTEHHTAYNPFEDGPSVPIRRKARESSESFSSAIDEDMYSQQTFKLEALDAHPEPVYGHPAVPTRRTPSPPLVSVPHSTSPPSKNPFQARIPIQTTQSYTSTKPVRPPAPPFLSATNAPRESYWTPSNLPSSDTPSRSSSNKGSDAGETTVDAWSSRERLSEATLRAEEEDGDSETDLEAGKASPVLHGVDTRQQQSQQLPYMLYGHAPRAKVTNVVAQPQQSQVKTSPNGMPHRFAGDSFTQERLILRTEDVPLPDSDEVDSSVQVANSSPTPSRRYAPPQSSPLRRRSSDVVVAPTSPQAVDVVLQQASKPNVGNAQQQLQQTPSQRKLPTPPSSHGTPPSVRRASPVGLNPAGPSFTSPPATVASAYATPAASSGQEDTPTRVRSRVPSPTPPGGPRSNETHERGGPKSQEARTQPQKPANVRTDTSDTVTTSPTVPTRAVGAPLPDRSFPVREDDYRARSARPIVYAPNWYQPPMYAPLDYAPDFIYMDPTHVQGGLEMSVNSHGSPAPSSAVLRDDIQFGTPRSPMSNLPAYEYPQEPLSEDPDAIKEDEMRNGGPFDPAEVQHALWVLEQQRRLYAPQPRYHAGSGHSHRFETTTPAEPHPLDPQERPQSTTSSNDPYSGIRPDAPVPPTPRSAMMMSTNVPYPLVYSPAPPFNAPYRSDQIRNFGGINHPLPPNLPHRRQYVPGGPRMFPPSIPSTAMSSPFVGPINPFLPPAAPPESTVSSPSHHPLPLPTRKVPRSRSRPRTRKQPPPLRVSSTLPPTSDSADDGKKDDDDDGELTPGRAQVEDETQDAAHSDDDEEEVFLEKDKDDKLEFEYHASYINVAGKRKKKFQEKYQELLRVFRELDRTTDATMLLMVSPSDPSAPPGTHLVASRSVLRTPTYLSTAHRACSLFSRSISAPRRVVKTEQVLREEERRRLEEIEKEASEMRRTLANIEAMAAKAESSGGEASLKAALRATLDGLRQMQKITDEREMRRRGGAARQQHETVHIEDFRRKLSGKVH